MRPHERVGPRAWDFALPVACAYLINGCAASPPAAGRDADRRAAPVVEPADVRDVANAEDDWRALVPAAFGTLLKDISVPLHEVLLFEDAAHHPDERGPNDCYGIDAPPPRFAGRVADEYLLCFEHDRLERIEVVLSLTAQDAARTLERLCGRWRDFAIAATDPSGGCAGTDGGTTLRARLAVAADDGRSALAVILTAAPP